MNLRVKGHRRLLCIWGDRVAIRLWSEMDRTCPYLDHKNLHMVPTGEGSEHPEETGAVSGRCLGSKRKAWDRTLPSSRAGVYHDY